MIVPKANITKELLESLVHAIHDEDGKEYCNPLPFEAEGVTRHQPLGLRERVQRILRSEKMIEQMRSQELETYDEANDFDVHDSFEAEPGETPYQEVSEEFFPKETVPIAEEGAIAPNASETQPEAKPAGESPPSAEGDIE